jgi:MoxR-like ATPase
MLDLLTSRGYLAERSLATVTYLALRMGRPLFLEGEAGVGKTEIAKVLAAALGRKLIRLQCYEGLDVASAVYEWNSAAQMIAIRLAEAAGDTDREQLSSDIFAERYLIKRPLLQALEPDVAGAPVLLIDELDRADEAFEAYLLEILSDFQVTIPNSAPSRRRSRRSSFITSNRTREIHDALKRRCLYHWVDYPDARARAGDRQVASARHLGKTVAAGRPLRAGAAQPGFLQVARRRRNHRLGHRADRTRRAIADPAGGRRHARRAAEIPGRHRADAGRRPAEGFEGSDERLDSRALELRHSGAREARTGIHNQIGMDSGSRKCAPGMTWAMATIHSTPPPDAPTTSSALPARCAPPGFRSALVR